MKSSFKSVSQKLNRGEFGPEPDINSLLDSWIKMANFLIKLETTSNLESLKSELHTLLVNLELKSKT